MLASTLRNRHGSARLDAQKGYAGTPWRCPVVMVSIPLARRHGKRVSVASSGRPPVQGRSELQAHQATVLECLAVEVREGLGRSPGPCHTSSASFLGTPQGSGRSPGVMPGQLSTFGRQSTADFPAASAAAAHLGAGEAGHQAHRQASDRAVRQQRALELARRNKWSWPLTVGVLKPNPGFFVHLFMQPHFVAPILAIEPALRPRRSRPTWR